VSGGAVSPDTGAPGLGLTPPISTCLFDLDGVLTQTLALHSAAWTQVFDPYLAARSTRRHEPFVAFDPVADYGEYVDGKQRRDGVRSFLASRHIELPEGAPDDPPDAETIAGLGNRKNEIALAMLEQQGVRAYPGSVRYLEAARDAGLRCAVVSSSTNCLELLRAARIDHLVAEHVDAGVAEQRHLRGKPAPDTFLAAAELLRVRPENAAVFEDSLAGVEAGCAGRFGLVVGIDRVGHAEALRKRGADIVVSDLGELLAAQTGATPFSM
jgi:beta-phosphoglucomutase family hydrolase